MSGGDGRNQGADVKEARDGSPGLEDSGPGATSDTRASDGRASDDTNPMTVDSRPGSSEVGGAGGKSGAGGTGGVGGTSGTGGLGGIGDEDAGRIIDSSPADSGSEGDAPWVVVPDGSVDKYTPPPDTRLPEDTLPPDAYRPSPTVNAGADVTVCPGASHVIGAPAQGGTAPYAYQWSADPECSGCISKPSSAQTSVNPDVTTTFTVTVTDSAGVTATDSVVVTVVTPTANAGAKDVTVDPGSSITIGTAAQDGTTYAWTCDRPSCALSSASEAQPTVTPSLSTKYTLTTTSPEGCVATDSTIVWVNLPVATTPKDGATHPANRPLFAQFGAAILQSSLSADTILVREAGDGTPVNVEFSYNATSRILTITPKGTNYNAAIGDYTLTLVGGEAGILSNDPIRPQRLPNDVVVNFTLSGTPDAIRPTIVNRSPTMNAGGVPTNAIVSAVWSEPLNPTTVTTMAFAVYPAMSMTPVAGTVTYDPQTYVVTFVPDAPLSAETRYSVWVYGIEDLSGNTAANTANWSFTTGSSADSTPPTVSSVVPADAATKIAANIRVTVTFSEPVKAESVVVGMHFSTGDASVSGTVEYDNIAKQAAFIPSSPLTKQTEYTVTVSGVQDVAGNVMEADFTSTFTTGG